MTRGEARLQHAANLLVGSSGLVYAWMLYLVEPEDPYSVANHPLQPDVQHLHVVTAPLLVFAVGMVWRGHVWSRIASGFRARRRSGIALALLFVPMVLSGYLLQVSAEEAWRERWVVLHVATSIAWIAAYVVHHLSRRTGAPGASRHADAPGRRDASRPAST